ncbi:MAG: Tm-1-like ATP-binding domain-containing protein [Pirellulales bacterium]
MKPRVYAIATMDTKGQEIDYVGECLRAAGVQVVTVDVGVSGPPSIQPDVTRETVLSRAGAQHAISGSLAKLSRADAIAAISDAITGYLDHEHQAGRVAGVLGIGGSGGTQIATAAMRALPVGLPKLMVSTLASGNTQPYVDCSDITMMYSVVDIAGLNAVSRRVLANAAHAVAGMVNAQPPAMDRSKPTIAMTMFGVTTPCVDRVRQELSERGYDCLVFHATGTGGRAMEKLVSSGMVDGVLDITTTEVADEVVGGILTAGPERFDAILRSGVPYVVSAGALDMVNFGGMATVPERFAARLLHAHTAQVTLMRTSVEENRRIARWIAVKLKAATSPVTVLLPERGVSMLDIEGGVFFDPPADAVLFDELEAALAGHVQCRVERVDHHINDPEFALRLVEVFLRQMSSRRNSTIRGSSKVRSSQ